MFTVSSLSSSAKWVSYDLHHAEQNPFFVCAALPFIIVLRLCFAFYISPIHVFVILHRIIQEAWKTEGILSHCYAHSVTKLDGVTLWPSFPLISTSWYAIIILRYKKKFEIHNWWMWSFSMYLWPLNSNLTSVLPHNV